MAEKPREWKEASSNLFELEVEDGVELFVSLGSGLGRRCYIFGLGLRENDEGTERVNDVAVYYGVESDTIQFVGNSDKDLYLRYKHFTEDVPGLSDRAKAGLEMLFGKLEEG